MAASCIFGSDNSVLSRHVLAPGPSGCLDPASAGQVQGVDVGDVGGVSTRQSAETGRRMQGIEFEVLHDNSSGDVFCRIYI